MFSKHFPIPAYVHAVVSVWNAFPTSFNPPVYFKAPDKSLSSRKSSLTLHKASESSMAFLSVCQGTPREQGLCPCMSMTLVHSPGTGTLSIGKRLLNEFIPILML